MLPDGESLAMYPSFSFSGDEKNQFCKTVVLYFTNSHEFHVLLVGKLINNYRIPVAVVSILHSLLNSAVTQQKSNISDCIESSKHQE